MVRNWFLANYSVSEPCLCKLIDLHDKVRRFFLLASQGVIYCTFEPKNFYAFSSRKLYAQLPPEKIAALPELCLLGKNRTSWSKWLWASSHSHIYLKLLFNQSLYTKFGPVKVRALKTPQHVTVHMPPHPRQAQQRNKFN